LLTNGWIGKRLKTKINLIPQGIKKIKKTNSENFKEAWKIYEEAFLEDESIIKYLKF